MTSYEHVMLGVTGGLAAGLHRRYGWPLVAVAGLAALLPDWDGLALAFGPQAFDRVHRVWGHSLWAAALAGLLGALLEYRFRVLERAGGWLLKTFPTSSREHSRSNPWNEGPTQPVHRGSLGVWLTVGLLAALSHLAADVLFSGHATQADWGLQLLWPWSEQAWAYPRVPWGEPVVTLLFIAGMFAMVRWPQRTQAWAIATLVVVAAYVALRVPLFGAFH